MRVRHLQDLESGQSWTSRCDGQGVYVRSGRSGKERETQKVFDDAEAARKYAQKEEMSRLRKGWVLSDPMATAGQPRMHRLLTGAFTGSMAIEAIGERLLCSRPGRREGDYLYIIETDGRVLDTIEAPPNRLIWTVKYISELGIVLLKADHQIMSLSLEKREFKALTPMNAIPVSFLSTNGTLASWYAEPDLVVCDMRDARPIFRKAVLAEKYHGHSWQMSAQLSSDGATLACCAHSGVITLFDVASGDIRATIEGDFEMIGTMAFIANDQRLVAQEVGGKWRLRGFDLVTSREIPDWPPVELGAGGFAIDRRGLRLALGARPVRALTGLFCGP